jgi:magnesium-transporting ATPase (P-type)
VNLWILTGDKEETAINIAVACNLVLPKQYMKHVIINKRLCPTPTQATQFLREEIAVGSSRFTTLL